MLEAKPQLDDVTARALVVEALDQLFIEEYDLGRRAASALFRRSTPVTSLTHCVNDQARSWDAGA
jgi:hypothetical protein